MAYLGVCYGPYRNRGWAPPDGPTEASVAADWTIIANRGFRNVRTYSVSGGDQWNVANAFKRNISLGLGIWIDANSTPNDQAKVNLEIDKAVNQLEAAAANNPNYQGHVDLVVGNELDIINVDPALVRQAMAHARSRLNASRAPVVKNTRVTACFTGTVLQHTGRSPWTTVVQYSCETIVYLTVYPFYGQKASGQWHPGNIDDNMSWSYNEGGINKSVIIWAGKQVVIAEIGWPSGGLPPWSTVEYEKSNFEVTRKWLATHPWNKGNTGFDAYWFEMFDEPWKFAADKPWEPYFGLYPSGDNPQPKFPFTND